jgi:hypothetical protein
MGEDAKWQLWKAESVGSILANASSITSPPREQVIRSLKLCIDNLSWGIVSRFASQFEIPLERLQSWLGGNRRPILQTILRITYRVGISPLAFLCGNLEIRNASLKKGVLKRDNIRKLGTLPLSCDKVKKILITATSQERPESLETLIGLTGWDRIKLKNHFPELCATIISRYADHFHRRIDKAKALPILKAASNENPPPAFIVVARRIGYRTGALKFHFPELARKIISRYKLHRHNIDWQFVEKSLKAELSTIPPRSMSEFTRSIGVSRKLLLKRFPDLTIASCDCV